MREGSYRITSYNVCYTKLLRDIVLLDVKMPKADGISALMKIKELNQDIKVVMLTTFEEGEYIYKACSNAADGYIVKDTKPEALVNVA